jgi:uncharacterized protein
VISVDDVVRLLQLQPHPVEGGHFRETYRSTVLVPPTVLKAHPGERHLNTCIYYMLTGDAVSEMHKLPGDEIYHFYLGDPLETLLLHEDGTSGLVIVGQDLASGQVPQLVIHADVWQGSVRRAGEYGFSLIGATMAPGFDYQDYQQGQREALLAKWPDRTSEIIARTPRG